MSSRSPVTYTRSPTQHDKDDPVVIKVLAAFCKFTSCLLNDHLYRGAEKIVIPYLTPLSCWNLLGQIRGMPYEATATEVCRFFKDCDIAGGPDGILLHPETNSLSWTFFQSWSKMNYQFSDAGIYFCLNDRGLPTGEAFIEMETPQVDFAMFILSAASS